MNAGHIIDGLIAANEFALTLEQVVALYQRVIAGDPPSEEELDDLADRNRLYASSILDDLDSDSGFDSSDEG